MQQGCPEPGYNGENCSSPCSKHCQGGHCDIVNKTCLGCVAGYFGSTCTGRYILKVHIRFDNWCFLEIRISYPKSRF